MLAIRFEFDIIRKLASSTKEARLGPHLNLDYYASIGKHVITYQ